MKREKVYRLKQHLVVPEGTVFTTTPWKTERYGEGHVSAVIGLSPNTSGFVEYDLDPIGELTEWFEEVPADTQLVGFSAPHSPPDDVEAALLVCDHTEKCHVSCQHRTPHKPWSICAKIGCRRTQTARCVAAKKEARG